MIRETLVSDDGMMPAKELAEYSARTALPTPEAGAQVPTKVEENTDGTAQSEVEVKEVFQRMHVCFRPSHGKALCFQSTLSAHMGCWNLIKVHRTTDKAYIKVVNNLKP